MGTMIGRDKLDQEVETGGKKQKQNHIVLTSRTAWDQT